jgi:hypothetical protein
MIGLSTDEPAGCRLGSDEIRSLAEVRTETWTTDTGFASSLAWHAQAHRTECD